jgi:hypothetical protein
MPARPAVNSYGYRFDRPTVRFRGHRTKIEQHSGEIACGGISRSQRRCFVAGRITWASMNIEFSPVTRIGASSANASEDDSLVAVADDAVLAVPPHGTG